MWAWLARLGALAGLLLEKEIDYLATALEKPRRPFVAIIGGAKVSGKIDVIEALLGKVDRLLVGGGMANTFFAAQGRDMADSLVEYDALDLARALLESAGEKLMLPIDQRIADDFLGRRRAANSGGQPGCAARLAIPGYRTRYYRRLRRRVVRRWRRRLEWSDGRL